MKSEYGKSDIGTFQNFLECVERSSKSGHNKKVDASQVTWYAWDTFFPSFFRNLIGITKYHHFLIDEDGVGCKEFADSEVKTRVTEKEELDLELFSSVIKPPGLSLERRRYLFNKIRTLCTNPASCDLVAPEPVVDLSESGEKAKENVMNPVQKSQKSEKLKTTPRQAKNTTDTVKRKMEEVTAQRQGKRRGRPPKKSALPEPPKIDGEVQPARRGLPKEKI